MKFLNYRQAPACMIKAYHCKLFRLLKANLVTDVHATKLELIKLLLSTQNVQVLQRIKEILEQEEEDIDFWDELNPEDQEAINEGIAQLNKGQNISHEAVRADIKKRFNF